LIEKYNINNIQSTKSISNYKKVNNYKCHLYFQNNLTIQNNNSIGKLELFVDKLIFEDAKRFEKNINLNDLPENEWYDTYTAFICYNDDY